jgi:hypothetical protein
MTPQDWSWLKKPMPHGRLVFGVFLLFLAVRGTCTGEAWAYLGQVVYRDEEPKKFWSLVATHYLVGIFLIGADVFEVPADFVIRVLFIGAFAYIVYLLIRWVIRQKR